MKKHYDIAITGFWWGANYGSLLNGYAIYCILKDLGKEVLMIHKPNASNTDEEITRGHNTKFVKKYYDSEDVSPVLSYPELGQLNDICDCFCAGSDQIWNYNLSFHENMFLPFVRDDKKLISFATSFGHKEDKTPAEAKPRISKYLHRYSAISVREQFDVDILRNNYGLEGKLVFEPVFCVDKRIYEEMAKNSQFDEAEPYLLTYILDPTAEKRAAIKFYQEKSGLKVINILDGVERVWKRNKEILNLPNILENVESEDFLKAFMNASYVITDSFHGTAFSIIFQKTFISLGNYNRGFERFVDLLSRLKLTDRLISDIDNIPHDEKFLNPINYMRTNEIIERERREAIIWLKNIIDTPRDAMPSIALHKNITNTLDKTLCTGCGACVSICPCDALSLQPDEMGYYRSRIDYDKCIGCGKCIKVCPALSLPENNNLTHPALFEFIAADETVLFNSSSGGAFPVLAAEAFKRGGVVAGAAWRDDFSVEHIIIDSEKDLHKLQKSKYLQSYLGEIFRQVKEKLDNDIFVLFTGCPCQVAGLKAYLEKDYDNLIKVDLLCGNSPSTMFFQKYVAEDFPDGIEKYEFRHKAQGWNWDCITITTIAGKTEVRRGERQDNYQRVYHNHTMCAPHCEKCKYQSVPRFGDLTIGDFWGIGNKDKSIDTQKGVSAVLCNNEKGRKFFEEISVEKAAVRKEVPLNWLGGNGYAIGGSHNYCSPKRNAFYSAIQTMPFSKAINHALKPNHGIYQARSFFNYTASQVHFSFDPAVWDENYINGITVLSTRMNKPKTGQYCMLSLPESLKSEHKYLFKIKFKIRTDSAELNFHVKDSGSKLYQIIYSYKPSADDRNNWVYIEKEFVPDCDFYDEFMIGAAQIRGEGRFIAIDFVVIDKV